MNSNALCVCRTLAATASPARAASACADPATVLGVLRTNLISPRRPLLPRRRQLRRPNDICKCYVYNACHPKQRRLLLGTVIDSVSDVGESMFGGGVGDVSGELV